jgi:hypothetical protein
LIHKKPAKERLKSDRNIKRTVEEREKAEADIEEMHPLMRRRS